MEGRLVLADIYWNVAADGFWDVAANWRDEFGVNRLPATDDNVFLNRAEGPFTITHRQDGSAIRSLQSGSSGLTLVGGSLTISAASQLSGTVALGGGSLIVNGPLSLSGSTAWTAGTITGTSALTNAGTLTYAAANPTTIEIDLNNTGTLHVQSGSLRVAGAVSQVSGTTLTGGTWKVSNGAVLDLVAAQNLTANHGNIILDGSNSSFPKIDSLTTNSGNFSLLNGRHFSATANLANSGTLIVGGQLQMNFRQLDNQVGGLIELRNDTALAGAGAVTNAGIFRKSSGGGTLSVRPFTNLGGTIDVGSGTLVVDGTPVSASQGPTWTGGHFQVAQGAALEWLGASAFQRYELAGNYTGSGAGTVRFGTGALHVAAAGATFNFAAGLFEWTGGTINGGTSGLDNRGTMKLAGPGHKFLEGALVNRGTMIQAGAGSFIAFNTSTLINEAGALYDAQGDQTISVFDFVNRGTLRRSAGDSVFIVSPGSFSNDGGAIDVRSGIVQISNGSPIQGVSTGGTFLVATGAILDLTSPGTTTNYAMIDVIGGDESKGNYNPSRGKNPAVLVILHQHVHSS